MKNLKYMTKKELLEVIEKISEETMEVINQNEEMKNMLIEIQTLNKELMDTNEALMKNNEQLIKANDELINTVKPIEEETKKILSKWNVETLTNMVIEEFYNTMLHSEQTSIKEKNVIFNVMQKLKYL